MRSSQAKKSSAAPRGSRMPTRHGRSPLSPCFVPPAYTCPPATSRNDSTPRRRRAAAARSRAYPLAMPPSPSIMPGSASRTVPASSSISSLRQSTRATRRAISAASGTVGSGERKSHSPHSAAQVGSNAPSVRAAISFARCSTRRRSAGTATASPPALRFTADSGDDSFHSLIRASTARNTPNTTSAISSPVPPSPTGTVTRTVVAMTSAVKVA